jgi:hypothetical protein
MSLKRWPLLGLLLFALPSLGGGCGGRAKPVKVEGIVTLDGKPLSGATVTFMPIGENGRTASGRTDTDGSFRLTTYRSDDGAVPGEYKVLVVVQKATEERFIGRDPETFTDQEKMEARMTMSPKGRKAVAAKSQSQAKSSPVPAIYGDVNKTPLKEVVPPEGEVKLALRSSAS